MLCVTRELDHACFALPKQFSGGLAAQPRHDDRTNRLHPNAFILHRPMQQRPLSGWVGRSASGPMAAVPQCAAPSARSPQRGASRSWEQEGFEPSIRENRIPDFESSTRGLGNVPTVNLHWESRCASDALRAENACCWSKKFPRTFAAPSHPAPVCRGPGSAACAAAAVHVSTRARMSASACPWPPGIPLPCAR